MGHQMSGLQGTAEMHNDPASPSTTTWLLQGLLEEGQQALLDDATAFRDANIEDVSSYEELKAAVADGKWARGPWAGAVPRPACVPVLFVLILVLAKQRPPCAPCSTSVAEPQGGIWLAQAAMMMSGASRRKPLLPCDASPSISLTPWATAS